MVQTRVFALFFVGVLTLGCSSDGDDSTPLIDADKTDSTDAVADTSPKDVSSNDAGTDSSTDTTPSDATDDTNTTDAADESNPIDAAEDTNTTDAADESNPIDAAEDSPPTDAPDDTTSFDAPDSADACKDVQASVKACNTPDRTDPTKPINILDCKATPDDNTDDTKAVQNAVNVANCYGGRIVYVPNGVFLINPDNSINMKNNTRLHLANQAKLKATASANANYAIVKVVAVSDVEIVGGQIEGERDIHKGTTGEWGMGISILGSKRVRVSNTKITNCWGDGIYVGPGSLGYCEDITIEKFTVHNNRRQGISVISAKNLLIKDGVASKTVGTPMQAGIDLEPNNASEYMLNVTLENIHTKDNAGFGLIMGLGKFVPAPATGRLKVTIINHTDSGSRIARGNIDKYIAQGYDITIK